MDNKEFIKNRIDDNEEIEVFKKSVRCDDDDDSNEEKNINRKRKRVSKDVVIKRECIDFGPCVGSPSGKSRKVYSSKVLIEPTKKNFLSKSKILTKNLAKTIPKPPFSLTVGIGIANQISNVYTELIEGEYFADNH
jgi:hypothetical protein